MFKIAMCVNDLKNTVETLSLYVNDKCRLQNGDIFVINDFDCEVENAVEKKETYQQMLQRLVKESYNEYIEKTEKRKKSQPGEN